VKLPLWWRRRREEELEEEIQSHLRMTIRDRMERGESAEEADQAARREFGNVGLIKETTRGMWGCTTSRQICRQAARLRRVRPQSNGRKQDSGADHRLLQRRLYLGQ